MVYFGFINNVFSGLYTSACPASNIWIKGGPGNGEEYGFILKMQKIQTGLWHCWQFGLQQSQQRFEFHLFRQPGSRPQRQFYDVFSHRVHPDFFLWLWQLFRHQPFT